MCKMGITRRAWLDIKFFIIFFLKFLENFAVSPCIFLWQCLLLTCMSFLCDLVFCLQMQKHFSNIYSIYWRWQFKTNFFRYMVSSFFSECFVDSDSFISGNFIHYGLKYVFKSIAFIFFYLLPYPHPHSHPGTPIICMLDICLSFYIHFYSLWSYLPLTFCYFFLSCFYSSQFPLLYFQSNLFSLWHILVMFLFFRGFCLF